MRAPRRASWPWRSTSPCAARSGWPASAAPRGRGAEMHDAHPAGTPAMWITFAVVVLAVLILDLGVIHRRGTKHTHKRAALWAGFCVAMAGAFALWVRHESGPAKALDFSTAYMLEEALSIDNLFVFLILFRALAVPAQH